MFTVEARRIKSLDQSSDPYLNLITINIMPFNNITTFNNIVTFNNSDALIRLHLGMPGVNCSKTFGTTTTHHDMDD